MENKGSMKVDNSNASKLSSMIFKSSRRFTEGGYEAQEDVKVLELYNPFAETEIKGGEGVKHIQAARMSGSGYWLLTLLAVRGRASVFGPIVVYAIYATLVVWELTYFHSDLVQANRDFFSSLQTAATMVGTALFFLQTFRTNSMYNRWWEGCQLWESANNSCSCIARQITAGGVMDKKQARRMLRWLCAYIICLKTTMRDEQDISELWQVLSDEEYKELEEVHTSHRALFCCMKVNECWILVQRAKTLAEPCTKEFEKVMPELTRIIGSMRRIFLIPMPFAYITHLRSFMVVWVAVLPFVFLPALKYVAIGVCIVIAYSLLGMEGICLEIEMPFGRDFNDLPTEDLALDAIDIILAAYQKTNDLPAPDGDDGDGAGLEWPKTKDPNSQPPPPTSFTSVTERRKSRRKSMLGPGGVAVVRNASASVRNGAAARRSQVAPEPPV